MPTTPPVPAVRLADGGSRITVGIAMMAWGVCWLAGNLLGGVVLSALGQSTGEGDLPVWATLVGALCLWAPILVGLFEVSRRFGAGSPVVDYGLTFRPVDLLGIPIGVLSQLVLLKLVYWPLESVWPDTFSAPKLEDSARSLYDSANGAWLVVLVVIVVVGAPFVEELLYRGLLQGAFARRIHEGVAVVLVAAWFAFIHFRPVEYPGLLTIGLVLGICAVVTRRLGLSIVAHCAFNATGLLWVASR
jgi:membrane protease YdiL (CAAX protease family)